MLINPTCLIVFRIVSQGSEDLLSKINKVKDGSERNDTYRDLQALPSFIQKNLRHEKVRPQQYASTLATYSRGS